MEEKKKLTKQERDLQLREQLKSELKKEVLAEIEYEKTQEEKRRQNEEKIEPPVPTFEDSYVPTKQMKNYYNMGFWFGLFFSFFGLIYFIAVSKSGSYERETACKGWLKGFYVGLAIAIALFVICEIIYSFYPGYFLD